MITFDSNRVIDAQGTQAGKKLPFPVMTHDGQPRLTSDGQVMDSTGAFLVGELERLDQTLHMPLASVTYLRDIELREDVTIADEASSFTLSNFAASGSLGSNGITSGKSWIGKTTDQVGGVAVDIAKIANALTLWGRELKFTIPEIESAARLGRPVDQQKYEAMQLKHQMDIDAMMYIGDTELGVFGLCNSALVTPSALPVGASNSASWLGQKTPDEILADVNTMLTTNWQNAAWARMPDRLLLPNEQFGYISTAKVSNAGNISILKYVMENNILTTSGQGKLQIFPVKWLRGAGAGGTIGTPGINRAVCYLNEYPFVRYPMTLLQRTPIQYDSIYHKTTYYARLGITEVVYPETVGYYDGL